MRKKYEDFSDENITAELKGDKRNGDYWIKTPEGRVILADPIELAKYHFGIEGVASGRAINQYRDIMNNKVGKTVSATIQKTTDEPSDWKITNFN